MSTDTTPALLVGGAGAVMTGLALTFAIATGLEAIMPGTAPDLVPLFAETAAISTAGAAMMGTVTALALRSFNR
jgi:hypothetical protein